MTNESESFASRSVLWGNLLFGHCNWEELMRRHAILSAAALLFGIHAASAADLGSYKDTGYTAPLAPIWTGYYVGGHLGGLWNDKGDSSAHKRY